MRALVTGCGRRLGFYLCEQLVAAGWQVTGSYRSERPELATLAALGVELVQADFGREEDVGKLIDVLVAHQDLALMIHNASAFEPQATDPAAQLAQFEQFYRVHMAAPFQLNQALAPRLASNPNASIIHITDIYIHAPAPRFASYVATKAGAHSLAMSFARELAPAVRVNTIEPGPILFLDEHDESWRQQVLAKTPLAREGGLEPIWQAVQLLMGNSYMTGASIKVDGGRALATL
ncbi:pteridine reductase [Aeromonas sp. HMWF036]|uniref:SDR family oxidoreductase n=1 Tax=unclassified Aeromonas TaxID=257493 RepID=UPI000D398448|nr:MULTISPECIES: SDR family oxidoreductase [unclassified Aeromonas]PTS74352.1 pteridine reductase [Aeromonas sp. HMWF036]PTT29772.1 pteridine reductase [Aeromonas sp. HMWF017]